MSNRVHPLPPVTVPSERRAESVQLRCRRRGRGGAAVYLASGFSAVELLIVMAIAAILLGLAMPSFRSFMQNSRLSTQANTLVYSLNLARSAAVKLDTPVEVCASSDGASCTGTWASGWIVCYPVVNCTPGALTAPTLLQVSPLLGGGNTVTEQITAATAVTYLANGQTNSGTGGTTYRFVFCDSRGATQGQDVEINFIGRIQASPTQGQMVSGVALAGC